MADTSSRLFIPRLVFVPTLFTLGVTLLRLVGELCGWPSLWFDKDSEFVDERLLFVCGLGDAAQTDLMRIGSGENTIGACSVERRGSTLIGASG
jgi:hypothetical protein